MSQLTQTQTRISWVAQIVIAIIFIQTLFFKFTGAQESIDLFTQLGAEPWGRIATGVAELVASLMLLTPATITLGALLAAGLMAGAIMSHFTVLGIAVGGDGGLLFIMATVSFLSALVILYLRRRELPIVGAKLG